MITKKCSKCEQVKEVCEFNKSSRSKLGVQSSCKKCKKIAAKKEYEKNKTRILNYQKEYYSQNELKIKVRMKKDYSKNQKDLLEYQKTYYIKNITQKLEYAKRYRETNKEKRNKYETNRKKTDPIYKIKYLVRNRIYKYLILKKITKKHPTFEIVGCTPQELKIHLEEKFIKDMSWDNQGEWHIDHIIPLASAKTEEELYKLCHFTNLQPMWALDNIKKGSKII